MNQDTLLKQKDKLNDYLELVREYMYILLAQSPLVIKKDPEKSKNSIYERLVALSKKPKFTMLDPNNPLVIRVEEELSKLQPEPTTPQALFGHLITLSTQLIPLRTIIAR